MKRLFNVNAIKGVKDAKEGLQGKDRDEEALLKQQTKAFREEDEHDKALIGFDKDQVNPTMSIKRHLAML